MTENYVESLLREISARKAFVIDCPEPNTLYIGGGTPSLMPVRHIRKIAETLLSVSGNESFDEFTVEVNPDDVTAEYALALRKAGVDRISMGIQSFNDRNLKWMNRRHGAEGAVKAFGILRDSGFENISVDLIFGYDPLSGKSSACDLMRIWEKDIDAAIRLRPEHVSAYQMGLDEGSALWDMYAEGKYVPPDDEVCAEQYSMLRTALTAAGYGQYEISNFALPGRRAIHNSAYWKRVPYAGFGPGAHSFDGSSRYWNTADLNRYIETGGCPEMIQESETLTEEDVFVEKVMLGLRTSGGIPEDMPGLDRSRTERMVSAGSLVMENGRLRIPADKFFISDSIIRELI